MESMEETEAILELQSEIEALQGQLASLEQEKKSLLQQSHAEDLQVKNWKWTQDATKFSGVSVNRCSGTNCTFHFHPMFGNKFTATYAMTINFRGQGYTIGRCYLPESIRVADLNASKPLEQLVWDISIMTDCYVNRCEQIKQLEDTFADNVDRTVSYTPDTQLITLRIKVSDMDPHSTGFYIVIILTYSTDGILPHQVEFEIEDQKDLSDEDYDDFKSHCNPFFSKPLLEAFREAF